METKRKVWRMALAISMIVLNFACATSATDSGGVTATASAGADQEVLVGDTVTLDGNSSQGVTSAEWTLTTVPTGSSAELDAELNLEASFTADVEGTYVATLSINGGESTDTVSITAGTIVAGITVPSDSTITTRTRFGTTEYVVNLEQEGATLSADGSEVGEGATIVSYDWDQIDGPDATLVSENSTGTTLAFTAPSLIAFQNESDQYKWQILPVSRDDRKMTFKLTTTDSNNNTDISTISVYLADNGAEIHTSSGLLNVGVGERVYLSGPSWKASSSAVTAVTDWSWTLTPPTGSSATFRDSSATTSTVQFPTFLPDVAGEYTVAYTSTTGGVTTAQQLIISASTYVGVGTVGSTTPVAPQCGNCHDGTVQPDNLTGYLATNHATVFEDAIGTYDSLAPEPYLWEFHTVGYNNDASNEGFDDAANEDSFEFPTSDLSFSDFVSENPNSAKLANVQCESCHGPGGDHNGNPTRTDFSISDFGVCGQCHIQESSWINSAHNSTGVSHGAGGYQSSWLGAGCQRCHIGRGFVSYTEALDAADGNATTAIATLTTISSATETGAFVGVQCAGCHDPHDATNDAQLRLHGVVDMLVDGSRVDAGSGAVCYSCHDGVYSMGRTSCDVNNDGTSETVCSTKDMIATSASRQVHYNPQAPVLEGNGGLTDLNGDGTNDFTLGDNSFHSEANFTLAGVTGDTSLSAENNKCVTCHMATGPSEDEEGYKHLGGHAFKLRSGHSIGHLSGDEEEEDLEEEAGEIMLVSACQSCHLDVEEDFDRTARADYDGDGTREGIQSEITGLLYAVSTKIKAQGGSTVISSTSGTTLTDSVYTVDSLSYTSTSSATQGWRIASNTIRRAVWNYNLIVRDGSLGVHNAAFAIELLQGTYTAVGGNSFATDYPLATQR